MRLNDKIVNGIISLLAVIVLAFAFGCDGGSGGGGGGNDGSPDVTPELMDGAVPPPDTVPEIVSMQYITEEGTQVEIDAVKGWVIVIFDPASTTESIATNLITTNGGEIISKIPTIGLYGVQVSFDGEMAFVDTMREQPNVLSVMPDVPLEDHAASITPNEWDNYLPGASDSLSWYLTQVNAPLAWGLINESTLTEKEIGIIEKSFYGLSAGSQDFEGRLQNEIPASSEGSDHDEAVHGTAVTAMAAAKGNNEFGNVGINWWCKVRLIHPKTDIPIISSLIYIYGLGEAVDQGSDVVNMSFGYSGLANEAIKYTLDTCLFSTINGINLFGEKFVVVKAAGNDNCEHMPNVGKPGNLIIVGASTREGGKATYSDYGVTIDIAAPGGDSSEILGWIDYSGGMTLPSYTSGTSFSAPLIAGAAALVWAKEPDLTPQQLVQKLKDTAMPFTQSVPAGKFGSGILDVYKALGGTEQTADLRIQVIDQNKNPASGIYVILHNEDGSMADYQTTGSDGVADFGETAQDHATITIAYNYNDEGSEEYTINSLVDIPLPENKQITWQIFEPEVKRATINVEILNSDYAWLEPFAEIWTPDDKSVDVYPSNIQNDGKISILASDEFTDVFAFLTDQILQDTYTFILYETPYLIPFTSNIGISRIDIDAIRKEVNFEIGDERYNPAVSSSFISTTDPGQSLVDYYILNSMSESGYEGWALMKKYESIPDLIQINMPNTSVNNLTYNGATASWTLGGTGNRDDVGLEFHFGEDTWWGILMDPSIGSWNINTLELPSEISSWVSGDINYIVVSIFDYDIATGFDNLWEQYFANPDLIPGEKSSAGRYIEVTKYSKGLKDKKHHGFIF